MDDELDGQRAKLDANKEFISNITIFQFIIDIHIYKCDRDKQQSL